MCPCSPNDVSIPSPTVPSGPPIPGFGIPFALPPTSNTVAGTFNVVHNSTLVSLFINPVLPQTISVALGTTLNFSSQPGVPYQVVSVADTTMSVTPGYTGPTATSVTATIPAQPSIPAGFPEDLLNLFNTFQFLIPPGIIKPSPHPNFTKDIFDAILSMMDQFFPFLMLYKFFLPVLNLIICIIEVLCALMNPFALISAINRLFSQCIPEFLNLFPIFALVIMIISLLSLLLSLIEYIASQILKLVNDILRNINALNKAFQDADANGVLAIAQKLGALLCAFQNVFVLLSIFNVVIEVIKDILRLSFPIPPCESGSNSGCCSTTTCPEIIANNYTRTTGVFQYLPFVGAGFSNGSFNIPGSAVEYRGETWQLYDPGQTQAQAFSNIYNAFDIPSSVNPKPIFFPTDSIYTATTAVKQAPYTINLRLFYNPAAWGRPGTPRYIRFDNCIMLQVPSPNLVNYNNANISEPTGVIYVAGGLGYEDNNTTILTGFASNGTTAISAQATLNNFLHKPEEILYNQTSAVVLPNDGYTFSNATYTFTPNQEVLFNKQITTLGCEPGIALNRTFVNTVLFGNVAVQTATLNGLVNSNNFPDPNAALLCLTTALDGLRSNLSNQGVAQFQATSTLCLNTLQNAANTSLTAMVGIGFNPCTSTMSLAPVVQFTSEKIVVSVNLNENSGLSLTQNLPATVAATLAQQIKGFPTFGEISNFTYDGYQVFTAEISSPDAGSGLLMVSFDNQIFCTNTLSADTSVPSTHTLQQLPYQFVYSPSAPSGEPRRDPGDVARDGSKGSA